MENSLTPSLTDSLTPRERFRRIMAHQEADRVPLDLAGTSLTAADEPVVIALQNALGLDGEPPGPYQAFDERILRLLDIDFRRVGSLIASGSHPHPGRLGYQIDMWGI